MNKKSKTKFFIVIALISAVLVFIISIISKRNKSRICRKSFDAITRIDIKQYDRLMVKLVKDGQFWTVNDLLPVRKEAIKDLAYIINNMQVKSKVDDHELFDIREQLINREPEVILWSNDEVVNSFFIGGQPMDSIGNYFIHSDDLIVYIVQIPGFKDDIQKYFSTNLSYWQDKHFLNHIATKAKYILLLSPHSPSKKVNITKKYEEILDSLSFDKAVNNIGIIDSLSHLYKDGNYLCRIEIFDNNGILLRILTCFDKNKQYWVLFSDSGDNKLALLLSKDKMDKIKSLFQD